MSPPKMSPPEHNKLESGGNSAPPIAHEQEKERAMIWGITLLRVRWIAILGQAITVLWCAFVLHLDFPFLACVLCIACSAFLNLYVFLTQRSKILNTKQITGFLSFDLIQLCALLALTGGLMNPFALLLLAPLVIGASLLPHRAILGLSLLAIGGIITLLCFAHPLPAQDPHRLDAQAWFIWTHTIPPLFTLGQASAFMIAIIFFTFYVWQTTREAGRTTKALAQATARLERQKQLAALGAQAASAAHELGSPLNTIFLIATECAKNLDHNDPLYPDIDLLLSQTERCRDILMHLTQNHNKTHEAHETHEKHKTHACHDPIPLDALITLIAEPYRVENPDIRILITPHPPADSPNMPRLSFTPEFNHALGHILQNAIQFATQIVTITLTWDQTHFTLCIHDDGKGFSKNALKKIGQPYFSERHLNPLKENKKHMGLGLFIAQTTLELQNAQIHFTNAPTGGAQVTITTPL